MKKGKEKTNKKLKKKSQVNENISQTRQRRIKETALRREKRKKKNYAFVYALLVVFSIAAALMATVMIFFKVETVVVSGNTKYEDKQIIADSGIAEQMNMFNIPSKQAVKTIKEKYPYIEDVKIKRNLPTEIEIAITEEKPIGFIKNDDGYTVLAESGKILEETTFDTSNIPMIKGLDVSGMKKGDYIDENGGSSKQLNILKKITSEFEKIGYADFDVVDMVDIYDIKLYYKDKYQIVLGSESELDYKAAGVKKLLDDELKGFSGVINVSEPSNISTRPMSFEDYRTQVQKNAVFEEGTDIEPQTQK